MHATKIVFMIISKAVDYNEHCSLLQQLGPTQKKLQADREGIYKVEPCSWLRFSAYRCETHNACITRPGSLESSDFYGFAADRRPRNFTAFAHVCSRKVSTSQPFRSFEAVPPKGYQTGVRNPAQMQRFAGFRPA